MQRIYSILVSILGESKQGYYDKNITQYQFDCPWERDERGGIPDGKKNCEVSLSLGKFHSWCCENKGTISYLIKKWGTRRDLDDYFSYLKDIKESKLYDLSLFSDNGQGLFDENAILLPTTFTKLDLSKCRKKKLVEYCNKRRITQDIIDYYDIGYTTWDEEKWQLRDRLIIPSYNPMGDLNYWIGRDFTGNDKKMKYWNSKSDKNEIVLHEDKINFDADVILVEGAIDCIYYKNAISLMGKALSKDSMLYNKLFEKCNANIVICLDSDTEINETKRIYSLLNKGRLRDHIRYIRMSDYKDFGEAYEAHGNQGIIELIRSQKKFSEIDLLI